MLKSDKVKIKDGQPVKLTVLTTSKVKPKEYEPPNPERFINVNKRQTKAVAGSMLTTGNYKDRLEAAKPKPKAVKKTRGRRKKK